MLNVFFVFLLLCFCFFVFYGLMKIWGGIMTNRLITPLMNCRNIDGGGGDGLQIQNRVGKKVDNLDKKSIE